MSTLHPNLARIAAAYDEIVLSFGSGLLSAPQARARIEALSARDDNGVEWSIDPDNGDWRYMSRDGSFAYAEPPTWGLATLTPHDLGSGSKDPDDRITFYEVDQALQTGLSGATRRVLPTEPTTPVRLRLRVVLISAVVFVAVLGAFVIGMLQ
jgi:hypothetical protein